jgi:hypothetical protein
MAHFAWECKYHDHAQHKGSIVVGRRTCPPRECLPASGGDLTPEILLPNYDGFVENPNISVTLHP